MSSCSLAVPTRELDSLEESLLVCLCSHSPLVVVMVGAFFFYVSGVVTNARSARTDGASTEELTCSKNQHRGSHYLISINGGDMLYFDQCMVGNLSAPTSSIEHAFCGMTGCDYLGSTMVPKVKHTGWEKIFILPCPRVPMMFRAL